MKVNPDGSINTSSAAGSEIYQGTSPWVVIGSVNVNNGLTGSFAITNVVSVSGNLGVIFDSDYLGVYQSGTNWIVLGSAAVSNFPSSYPGSVSQATSPWITLGSTHITNFPTYFPGSVSQSSDWIVTGSVNVIGSVNVNNFTLIGSLGVQTILGSVAITNDNGSVYSFSTASNLNYNPKKVLVYSGTTTAIGSIYELSAAGSLVQVLSYDASDRLSQVGVWTVV